VTLSKAGHYQHCDKSSCHTGQEKGSISTPILNLCNYYPILSLFVKQISASVFTNDALTETACEFCRWSLYNQQEDRGKAQK